MVTEHQQMTRQHQTGTDLGRELESEAEGMDQDLRMGNSLSAV